MNRQLKFDIGASISFITGTLLLFLGSESYLRAIGALMHYFGAMVLIAGFGLRDYLRREK